VPTLVAKTLPPPPPRRLVIDIARRGLRLILVVGRRDDAVEPFADGVPDRRATARAISLRPSGRRPLSFHGAPDFIRVQPTS
jgi:hypothetical protein